MKIRDKTKGMPNKNRYLSLRMVLIVPYLIQALAIVGLTSWLSWRYGQKTLDYTVNRVETEIITRVQEYLSNYLNTPYLINQINANAIALGELNPQDDVALQQHFWRLIQLFDNVGNIAYGTERGEFTAVQYNSELTELVLQLANESTNGGMYTYSLDSEGNITRLQEKRADFDPRQRSWYQKTVSCQKPCWNEIFSFFSDENILVIPASQPVYNAQGELQGILSTRLYLTNIHNFLNSLTIPKTGEIFIMERNGEIVASSSNKAIAIKTDTGVERLSGTTSQNPLIRATVEQLGDLATITTSEYLEFKVAGEKQLVQVMPISDNRGLDWLIVLIIPESDFSAEINANTRNTIILSLLALLLAIAVTILTSRLINKPIVKLITASKAIAEGNFNQDLEVQGIYELKILAHTFNQMAQQLQQSFLELENRVEKRTAQLKKAKEAADQANQAKSQFLSNISHELRTPLNGILGYAQILEQDRQITPKQQEGLTIITQCGNHLLTLIDDLLDLAKIEAGKMELSPIDFHFQNFIEEINQICRLRAANKHIYYQYQPLTELPTILHADIKRLRQILLNLIDNAIKFTNQGGVIFTVAFFPNQGETAHNKIFRIQVQDTGKGLTSEQIDNIFLPFEQVNYLDNKVGGVGLGLAITQELVELMQGKITVTSSIGQGSIFSVDLPVSATLDAAVATNIKSKTIIGVKGHIPKILVVDDSQVNRLMLGDFLTSLGINNKSATNGEECLVIAREFQPDLIITDLLMSGMDVWKMMEVIRRLPEFLQTKIMISSASNAMISFEKMQQYNCIDFIAKPINFDLFINKLQFHLSLQWLYEDESYLAPELLTIPLMCNAVKKGDIKEIIQQANQLKIENNQYTDWANYIITLAENFQIEKIQYIFNYELS